jgi:ankyrin repeat protein
MTADPAQSPALLVLMRAIAAGDGPGASAQLAAHPALVRAHLDVGASRADPDEYFLAEIAHPVYAGDTALHVAAAANRVDLVGELIALGADLAAANRRGAQPLHYAVDGGPSTPGWDPAGQSRTITALLDAGADVDAGDRGGVTPLHRAIRNRCAKAVGVLLERGADATRPNGRGTTARQLATASTGRGGTGSAAAKAQQAQIVELLHRSRLGPGAAAP